MVHHIVMWKLKEDFKKENAQKMKEQLDALKEKIKELEYIYVGFNMEEASKDNFDIVLDARFQSFDNFTIYAGHPEHLKVVNFINTVVEQRVVIDYEV